MARRTTPILLGVLIGLLAAGLFWLLIAEPRGEAVRLLPPPSPAPLRIHVSGAIARPGVYSLPRGSIVGEAIEAAGGPVEGADIDRVNLAAPLDDGQQVRVPFQTQAPAAGATAASDTPASGLVNINIATAPELELLPGIGPSLAQAIVSYRDAHGIFHQIEDLLDVPGIGPAKLEQIRGLVTVE